MVCENHYCRLSCLGHRTGNPPRCSLRRFLMSNTSLAREHWDKAFDYFWTRNRRLTITEARLAMTLNPSLARPHWLIGQVYLGITGGVRLAILRFSHSSAHVYC